MNAAAAEALGDPRVGPVTDDELEADLARWDPVEARRDRARERATGS
jgi:hypothetical protein